LRLPEGLGGTLSGRRRIARPVGLAIRAAGCWEPVGHGPSGQDAGDGAAA
jgi:hypothetical protein